MAHLRDIRDYVLQLDALGVPRHPDVDKALAHHEYLHSEVRDVRPLASRLIDLDHDQLRERYDEIALRSIERSGTAFTQLSTVLGQEASAVMANHAPQVIKALRPAFDRAAKGIAQVTKAGIHPGMSAEDVIALNRPEAVTAWQNRGQYTRTLRDIAHARIQLSEMFGVAPALTHGATALGERVDYTACFTHPDSGVITGYGLHRPDEVWLALSTATAGRLRLNLPDETERMLHGEGDSPGWIVSGAGAVVFGGEGKTKALQLYHGEWIPTWVPQEQIDHLLDVGHISPARPGAERPADKYPLGSDGKVPA